MNRDKNRHQGHLFSSSRDQLNQNHPLYRLTDKIAWNSFEKAFRERYSPDKWRLAKPIRLMCGLLILKYLRDLSDEAVVEQWGENAYYQYFCGCESFTPAEPCNASELVHFRNRIGKACIELILRESIRVNDEDTTGNGDRTAFIDSTVQEKNITYPTDSKLHRKIIRKCGEVADGKDLPARQSYSRTLKKLAVDQRFRNNPRNRRKAVRADRKVWVIAGRLVRELERNLGDNSVYISKGKEHKKYEFGNKVSIITSRGYFGSVIV